MTAIVKQKNPNAKIHFITSEMNRIFGTAEAMGWMHHGEDTDVFSEEVSRDLCAALEEGASKIKEVFILEGESKDSDWAEMETSYQLELIWTFLEFCKGEAFRIDEEL